MSDSEDRTRAEQFHAAVEDMRESLLKSDMHYRGSTLASFRDGSGMHPGVFDAAEVIAGYVLAARREVAQEIADWLEPRLVDVPSTEILRHATKRIREKYGLGAAEETK